VTLKLTISAALATEFDAVACVSYKLPWDSTVLASGDYLHTYKTAGGCDSVVTAHVTIGSLSNPIIEVTQPTCAIPTGTIRVTSPTTGLEFAVDGGAYTSYPSGGFSGLATGAHTIKVKNAAGCETTLNQAIGVAQGAPTAIAVTTVNASCGASDGTITLGAVTGGTAPYAYSIDGSVFNANTIYIGLGAGLHTINVKDANGCTFSTTATISNINSPTITFDVTDPTCITPTGTITLTSDYTGLMFSVDGGSYATYPSGVFAGLTSGVHVIKVRNSAGCVTTLNPSIGASPEAPLVTFATIDPTCAVPTGTITVTSPTTGLEFAVDGGTYASYPAGGFSGLVPGPHTIKVRNAAGCETTLNQDIDAAPEAPTATLAVVDPTCAVPTGTITVTSPTTGLQFAVDGGAYASYPSGGFSGLASGPHTIKVKNAAGCETTLNISVGDPQSIPLIPAVSATDATCAVATGSIQITAPLPATGISYSINGTDYTNTTGVFNGLLPGTYKVTVKNASGCISETTTATINNQATDPKLVVTNPQQVCGVGSVDLTSASITQGSDTGLQFSYWRDVSATQIIIDPKSVGVGTYYIKATTSGGCYTIKPIIVTLSTEPNATISGSDICLGDNTALTIQLNGQPPFTLTYTDGTSAQTVNITSSTYQVTVSPTQTTTYRIQSIIDANCVNTNPNASVTVQVTEAADGMRYPSVIAQANKPLQLNARFFGNNYTYSWDPKIGLNDETKQQPIFNYNKQTEYTIAITSNSGCITIDTLLVKMAEEIPGAGIYSDLFVPKAWTPNGDGHNDKLYPLTVHIKQLFYFRIFDRWGQLMFETTEIGKGWDGMFNGKQQVMDVYTWTVEAIGEDGRHFKRAGNSVLLR
jgi:gliding motility-associated-like protein